MLRCLLGLSGALLLAACGSSSSADRTTTMPDSDPARVAAPIGKTVSIIVGSGAGGGFDTTARLVARHIGRHIPGAPTVIVVNMPGGGGLIAANYLFNVAPKDGTVIGLFHEAQVMNQLTGGEGVQFDILKFNWLGSSYDDPNVCIIRSDGPVKRFQDLIGRAEPIAIGGTGPGSNSHDAPQVLAQATGANLRTVSGYSSTNDVRLGIERGEVQGMCLGWESVRSTSGQWLEDKYAHVFVQNGSVRHRDLPDVPLALEFARDEDSRMMLKLLDAPSSMSKPFALPPDVDEGHVRVMRSALSATYHDPLFLAEAAAMRLDFQPKTAVEIHQLLSETLATPRAIAGKYRQVVQP
jgi:tripartite-type tricarboxylate transporter receptor subunit TctC